MFIRLEKLKNSVGIFWYLVIVYNFKLSLSLVIFLAKTV